MECLVFTNKKTLTLWLNAQIQHGGAFISIENYNILCEDIKQKGKCSFNINSKAPSIPLFLPIPNSSYK